MILGYSVYEITCLFFIYAFLGWCVEVVYCGLNEGHFINRGFLNGPLCPIYGVGGALVVLCLTPIADNLPLLFAGSAILTSALELITGFALDKIFHARWWDYSDKPFNLGGYICLKYSVYWGLVCIALMKGIHPAVMRFIDFIPRTLGIILLILFALTLITDIVITVISISHLTRRVKLMEEIASNIHSVSDKIGESVYDGAVKVRDKGMEIYNSENAKEIREKRDELKDKYEKEIAELKEKYAALEKPRVFQRRIIKAFPKLRMHNHNEQLESLKQKFKSNQKKDR